MTGKFRDLDIDKVMTAPDDKFVEIFRLAKQAAETGDADAADFLQLMRPRLVMGIVARDLTWQRLMVVPFEHLLTDGQGAAQGLSRDLLRAILIKIEAAHGPALTGLCTEALAGLTGDDPAAALGSFYAAVARVLKTANLPGPAWQAAEELLPAGPDIFLIKTNMAAGESLTLGGPLPARLAAGLDRALRHDPKTAQAMIDLVLKLFRPADLADAIRDRALPAAAPGVAALMAELSRSAASGAAAAAVEAQGDGPLEDRLRAALRFADALALAGRAGAGDDPALAAARAEIAGAVAAAAQDLTGQLKAMPEDPRDALLQLALARSAARDLGRGEEVETLVKAVSDGLTQDVRKALRPPPPKGRDLTPPALPTAQWLTRRLRMLERIAGPEEADALLSEYSMLSAQRH